MSGLATGAEFYDLTKRWLQEIQSKKGELMDADVMRQDKSVQDMIDESGLDMKQGNWSRLGRIMDQLSDYKLEFEQLKANDEKLKTDDGEVAFDGTRIGSNDDAKLMQSCSRAEGPLRQKQKGFWAELGKIASGPTDYVSHYYVMRQYLKDLRELLNKIETWALQGNK